MKFFFIAFLLSGCLGFPYMPNHASQCVSSASDGKPPQWGGDIDYWRGRTCPSREIARVPSIINLPHPSKYQDQHTESEEELPYPDAKFPENPGAVAASGDSDCFGLIEIPPGPVRVGTWAIFVSNVDEDSFLYFNTKQDAFDCAGSEPARFAKMTKSGWVEQKREN